MPVLYLENIPDELFRNLEELAAADHIPLTEETLHLLEQAVAWKRPLSGADDRANVQAILDQMRRNAIIPGPGTPDSVDLLCEDRMR